MRQQIWPLDKPDCDSSRMLHFTRPLFVAVTWLKNLPQSFGILRIFPNECGGFSQSKERHHACSSPFPRVHFLVCHQWNVYKVYQQGFGAGGSVCGGGAPWAERTIWHWRSAG